MKALGVFPAERRFEVIDHPEPQIGTPTQVKIRILEVGICGTDKEIVAFEYGTPPDGSPYLILGHESLGEVVEVGSAVKSLQPGNLVVPTVRRPCELPDCTACDAGRQDFCYTGQFTERGIKQRHGYMAEFAVEDEQYVQRLPSSIRDIGVLTEPLTIAEKGVTQLWQVQQRLPWACPIVPGEGPGHCRSAVVLGAGPVGLLGAMKLTLEGFDTTVYSRTPSAGDVAQVVESIGAKFVHAEQNSVEDLARSVGNIDVVYEAVGASSLAFDVMKYLGTNGVFIFTGVPGRKGPISVDADAIMRNHVLKNQVIFGTVNASRESFASAVDDLGEFSRRWPDAVRSIISHRIPLAQAAEPLSGKVPGIKNVIQVANSHA